jgi:transcriptional regulator with XRE-family HTH domain
MPATVLNLATFGNYICYSDPTLFHPLIRILGDSLRLGANLRKHLATVVCTGSRWALHAYGVSAEDDALRAVIRQRMRERGLNPAALAQRVGERRDRFYRVLSGDRGLTAETLALIAQALDTTVLDLRREAGVLTVEERRQLAHRVAFADFVQGDPLLSQEAKDVLIRMYEQLVGKAAVPTSTRIRQLQERVAQHERDVAELQRLLAERARQADAT